MKPANILVAIAGAAVLVAVGWWLGSQHRFLTDALSVATVDKELADMTWMNRVLLHLDSGRVPEAKDLLALRLEGEILSVDSMLDYTDARTHAFALKVFRSISEVRDKNPANYMGPLARTDATINARIDSILERAKRAEGK